ncbi:NAD-dependent epimerase/dehydratase family protein [Saprospiraceae bacterium]|nr:NAD-dependent epimerase/dehydratase family protein [Saprospiraceae bacterium]
MKIGITGQKGFVGSHLWNFLKVQEEVKLVDFERDFFEKSDALEAFVSECDVIYHLAAMNRHESQQVIYDTNVSLVKQLISACTATNSKPWIIISSSSQEDSDNLYGNSKKEGRELLEKWAAKVGAKTTGMVIPNVFGPFGKPFYNSVFATFCHQVIAGEQPNIINDGDLKLIYVNELIEEFYSLIASDQQGRVIVAHRHEMKVSELLQKLNHYKDSYLEKGNFPDLTNATDLAMFNSFRCYIPHNYYPRPFVKHSDNRGSFVEIVRAGTTGQSSFSTTVPGITRGNHFHTRKAERFAVIKGRARIDLRKVDSDEIISYEVNGENPSYVDMPIWYTHNITNIGEEELLTIFWINEPYDPANADTYFVNV